MPARPNVSDIQPAVRTELYNWAKENQNIIPNLGRLYKKMEDEGTDDHYIQAHYAKKLHECGCYRISDIEMSTGEQDVDIQLGRRISIQVWYGMNAHGYVMEAQLRPGTPQSDAIGKHMGTPTDEGGVPTDFENDKKTILKKLARLPDDTLGILLLHSGRFGYWVSFNQKEIPANKCILIIGNIDFAAELYCSSAFNHLEEIKNIVECLGLDLVS